MKKEEGSLFVTYNHTGYNEVKLVFCIQPSLEEKLAATIQCQESESALKALKAPAGE